VLVIILKKYNERFFSIRWRLVITYFIIILLTLFLISIYILNSLEEYFFNQKNIELLTKANVIASMTSAKYIEYNHDMIKNAIPELQIGKEIRVIVTDKEAKVLFDTAEEDNLKGKVLLKEQVLNALKGKDDASAHREEKAGWVVDAAVPILKDQTTIGVVYLSTSAEEIMDFLRDIQNRLYAISFVVSILIGIMSFVFAGVITAPVEQLTRAIRHMSSDGQLNQKVEIKGNDEIAQLGMAFNTMTERLNEVEDKRRQFVSNASHELRTPLSSIKLLAESILQMPEVDVSIVKEFLVDINNEIDRLSRIIDKLLNLTKMDMFEHEVELTNVNLRKLIRGILKTLSPLARKKHINIRFHAKQDIYVLVDEDKIWEAIFNIIDNSIKYTPEKGKVEITLDKNDYNVLIAVQDNGIGIPKDETEKIFDRFYRVDKARARETGGTGLGLSIALSAVKAHGGDIMVESEENVGSKFTILIPFREK